MTAKRITPKSKRYAFLDAAMQRKRQVIINNYIRAGEMCIAEARKNHKYIRRTGNLTSSIGYAIIDNGRVYNVGGFDKSAGDGAEQGNKFLKSLLSNKSDGLSFVMVAGMKYATYVEAMNLNVLESAEMLAERILSNISDKLYE